MANKEISTSIYSFEDLINANGFYVDKTEYFYRLVSGVEMCFFCSRPRRFGKSLAISTLKAIFEGKKDLFKGLYIYDKDYDWETYPVIHIDFANTDVSSAEILRENIHDFLVETAKKYGVEFTGAGVGGEFSGLISALREKTGKKVVILIDEYDNPLTENIDNLEELEKVRKILDAFYQIIKGQNANERFVFMTGVTKFSKVSIFSKLNNLQDITMWRDWACMFGYTQDEMEKNFMPYIDGYIAEEAAAGNTVDKAAFLSKIKLWYNGFKFDYEAETVYNPVSIGQFFKNHCRFANYWFNTGTPRLLANMAKKHALTLDAIKNASLAETDINAFMVEDFARLDVSPEKAILLLLQTGYLTIDRKENVGFDTYYDLRYPNYEVQNSYEKILCFAYMSIEEMATTSCVRKVWRAVTSGDTPRMIELLQDMLSQIPYSIQMAKEKYYQSLFYLFFKMCGMEISAESETNIGRIDAVLQTEQHAYIFELKMNKTAAAAMEQIENKKYFEPFIEKTKSAGQTLHCVGMNFNNEKDIRNIDDWKEF